MYNARDSTYKQTPCWESGLDGLEHEHGASYNLPRSLIMENGEGFNSTQFSDPLDPVNSPTL